MSDLVESAYVPHIYFIPDQLWPEGGESRVEVVVVCLNLFDKIFVCFVSNVVETEIDRAWKWSWEPQLSVHFILDCEFIGIL